MYCNSKEAFNRIELDHAARQKVEWSKQTLHQAKFASGEKPIIDNNMFSTCEQS